MATRRDIIHWEKQGPAFLKAYNGKYVDQLSKGGSVISRYYDDGRVVPEKINGKYWMYLINYNVAFSDDCINWTPVIDDKGHLIRVLPPRAGGGKFDCNLIEPGPPPVVTPKGILVIYHGGKNGPKRGDPNLPKRHYAGGQALFDLKDPTKMIARCDNYFLTPRTSYELNSSVGAPVCFMGGLVRFKGKWFLHYEAGDHVGAMASCDRLGFELQSPRNSHLRLSAPIVVGRGERTFRRTNFPALIVNTAPLFLKRLSQSRTRLTAELLSWCTAEIVVRLHCDTFFRQSLIKNESSR